MDIATLGFEIDTSQAAQAADNLDKMSQASARAESGSMRVQMQAEKTAASIRRMREEMAPAVSALVSSIDPLAGKFAKLDEQLAALSAFKKSGAISGEDFVAYAAKIEATRAALGAAEGATHSFNLATSQARVELGRMFKDIATGQYGRLTQSTTTLAAQTGLLTAAMRALISPMGIVAGLGVGLFAGIVAEAISASAELDSFNKSLIATGGYAGESAQQLSSLASGIGVATGHFSDARTALDLVTKSGKFTADELSAVGQGAVEFAALTGTSVEKAVGVFEKLADQPAKYSAALNESLHYLTPEIEAQIAALENEGRKSEAAALAERTLFDTMNQRYGEFKTQQSGVAKGWDEITESIGRAVDQMRQATQGPAGYSAVKSVEGLLEGGPLRGFISGLKAYEAESARVKQANAEVAQSLVNSAANYNANKVANDELVAAIGKLSPELANETKKLNEQAATLGKGRAALLMFQEAQEIARLSTGKTDEQVAAIEKRLDAIYGPAIRAAQGLDQQTQSQKAAEKAAHEYEAELAKVPAALSKIDDMYDSATQQQTQLSAETNKYNRAVDDLVGQLTILNDTGKLTDAELAKAGDVYDALTKKHEAYAAQIAYENSLRQDNGTAIDQLFGKLNGENAAITTNTEARERLIAEQRAQHEMQQALLADAKRGIDYSPEEIAAFYAKAKAAADYGVTLRQVDQQLQEWERIATQAFDSVAQGISKDIVEGGSIMGTLKDTAKQTVEAIIAQFARLEFLGPFMRMLFGNSAAGSMGFSAAGLGEGLIGNLFGGGGGSSFGGSGSIIGSIAQAFGGGSSGSGGGFDFFSAASWINAGKTIWSGFSDGFSSFIGTNPALMGPPTAAGQLTSFQPGYTSGLGQALGVAGGLYAGYNEFNAAGGGVAGLAGGAAYGVGTYFAGAAVSSAMAGGVAAGMAAIPVVGWIALAAMAINMISGGKLFGTAASPTGGDLTETIGSSGASLTNVLHEKGQKALFGGAYYKDVNQPVDPQAQAAADAFFAALQKGTTDFASAFGATMTNIVGGSFDQKYDKNGKPTTSSDTVLGVTYAGETQAQFGERIQAENFIAVLDKLGVNATAYSQSFIGNADDLSKAIADLGAAAQAAYADIKAGAGLLGSSGSLGDVMSEVEKLDVSGEALADAYKRLVTENDAWKSSIEASILTTGKSATATLEFADALSKAFGSASAMQQALATFDKTYYTAGQLSAIQIANDQAKLATAGAAIGQSPTETLAQFKAAFQQVESTLTPDQLAQWINFGNLLAQVNGEVQTAASSYAQFMAQFGTTTTAFEQAMQKVNDSLAANIAQADSLAQANGQAGASAADIGKIISASVMQGVAAVQQLATEAAGLSQTLFGGDLAGQIANLKTEAASGNQVAAAALLPLLAQQTQQQKQAAAAQQFMQASQLFGDLAQIGAITGQGLGDFAKMIPGFSTDKLATLLHTDQSGLQGEFKKQEDAAKAAMQTADNTKYSNQIQTDILDVLQGIAPQFSPADIYAALTGNNIAATAAAGPGKGGARGGTGGPIAAGNAAGAVPGQPSGTPGDPVTTKNPDTTTAITNMSTQVVKAIRELGDRTTVRDRYVGPRNSRPAMA
jgi:phage-related minor tail protein/type II secretory pathway pseudopilin PulG